ncbi:M28 family peptidase [Gallaecimonas kandeliae]|uniref:M28 family peptidase n=1 Tax=Gallaecimonas kandeliae TaxID=3029055 RepID=UPI002647F7B0|nr:M28 family peptidase [Gallaecimonas kandeliae]WKE66807.1 M28 family peptidase [Gallaecimonas kandeliae]
MRILLLCPLLAACQSSIPCNQGGLPNLDPAPLLADVRVLASPEMNGRRPGTPGHQHAEDYIRSRFAGLGYQVLTQAVPQGGDNIIAYRGQPRIWLLAHYDHLGVGFPGADDNASGVAVLLALAARYQGDIAFIATDSEEEGLYGAKALLAAPPLPLPKLVINFDMVGHGPVLYAAGTHDNPGFKPLVLALAKDAPLCLRIGHDRREQQRGSAQMTDWRNASDHAPFRKAGIPYLYFGNDVHADYHQRSDVASHIRPDFLAGVAETALELLNRLDDKGLAPWQGNENGGKHE